MKPLHCEISEDLSVRYYNLLRNSSENIALLQSKCHVRIYFPDSVFKKSGEVSIHLALYFCLERVASHQDETGIEKSEWKASFSYVVLYQAAQVMVGLLTKPSFGGIMRIAM
jgi:hypothetical protein